MDAPLSVYMDFLTIYVKFQLNKVLFSQGGGGMWIPDIGLGGGGPLGGQNIFCDLL